MTSGATTTGFWMLGTHAGLVGEYAGEVGEYAGEVGEAGGRVGGAGGGVRGGCGRVPEESIKDRQEKMRQHKAGWPGRACIACGELSLANDG
eukprot:1143188-Pelagomonas_calceolata.AAC.8